MVPVIAASGASFFGAFQYYCHDKRSQSSERVDWTQTVNMLTDCVAKAWKVMAYTAKHQSALKLASGQKATGARMKKPVFAFSLSWAPEQRPDKKAMLDAARRSLDVLGLSGHQAIIVAHNDRAHRHVHVIANTVHPMTGIVAKLKHTKRQLSDFALDYEREGGKIFCQQREENQKQREAGKQTRYVDPVIAEAWKKSRTGQEFVAALEASGYHLAQGRKRLVVMDAHGKAHNPNRHIQGVKAAEVQKRLADLDMSRLPAAEPVPQIEKAPAKEGENKQAQYEQAEHRQPEPKEQERKSVPAPTPSPLQDTWQKAQQSQPWTNQPTPQELRDQQLEKLAALHKEQRKALSVQQTSRTAFSKRHLAQLYGLKGQKEALLVMKQTLDSVSWWKRALGLTRKDMRAFDEQMRSFQKDVGRYREKLHNIRQQHHEDRHALKDRQAKERWTMDAAHERQRQNEVNRLLENTIANVRQQEHYREPGRQTSPTKNQEFSIGLG